MRLKNCWHFREKKNNFNFKFLALKKKSKAFSNIFHALKSHYWQFWGSGKRLLRGN